MNLGLKNYCTQIPNFRPDKISSKKVCYFNARSLRNKIPELLFLTYSNSFDVILVSESWLQSDDLITIPGFVCLRADRSAGIGVGVCAFIKNDLSYSLISSSNCLGIEYLWVDIVFSKSRTIRFGLYYFPPNRDNLERNFEILSTSLTRNAVNNSFCILLGDFNMGDIDWDIPYGPPIFKQNDFVELTQSLGFHHQLVNESTRGDRLLDLVFVSDIGLIKNLGVFAPFSTSDHDKIIFEVEVLSPRRNRKFVKNFFKADYAKISEYYRSINWDVEFFNCATAQQMWEIFMLRFEEVCSSFVPNKTIISGSPKAVVYSCATKAAFRKKRKVYKRLKYERDFNLKILLKTEYKDCCKLYKRLVRNDMYDHEKSILQSGNPKDFFQIREF